MGLIVDNFAGGGGASCGIQMALGRSVDIAINHDPEALALHKINHPNTEHYCESVWDVDPIKVTKGQPVDLAWFSPDCKHFSKAKGAVPVEKKIRGLAWVVIRWAIKKRPRLIFLENVEEFQTWGRLDENNRPCPDHKGEYFKLWKQQLIDLGYQVEHRQLVASDYGAPTSRKRFFLIARNDGEPIVFPKATHGDGLQPIKTAGDCIDWSIPCPSIFTRKKPLAQNTLNRIGRGIEKFCLQDPEPFIVRIGQTGWGGSGMQYPISKPLTTITSKNEHCLVMPFISKLRNNCVGHKMDEPLHTISGGGLHHAEVQAFLIKYYGTGLNAQALTAPLHAITGKARFGLVAVAGEQYQITDIGLRMLTPRELYKAQGFPDDYQINVIHDDKPLTQSAQIRMCGNSVPPLCAKALVEANYGINQADILDSRRVVGGQWEWQF